jgi:hypothetical protein
MNFCGENRMAGVGEKRKSFAHELARINSDLRLLWSALLLNAGAVFCWKWKSAVPAD